MISIKTIDLMPMNISEAIGVFLIKSKDANILVECGPSSTVDRVVEGLKKEGLDPQDLDGLFVTHIHLDHAGATGFFTSHGVPVFVHPKGSPHLIDPSKLMKSAGRVYGESVSKMWGQLEPSSKNLVNGVKDQELINIKDISFTAIETVGHADHHHAWRLEGDSPATFCGDAAGMVIPGTRHITLPMPPPEFDLMTWRNSLDILESELRGPLILTHFGEITNPKEHLNNVKNELNKQVDWIVEANKNPNKELKKEYREWLIDLAIKTGVDSELASIHISESLASMSVNGILLWESKKQKS